MKLYWRFKKDGKWTWAPAQTSTNVDTKETVVFDLEEAE